MAVSWTPHRFSGGVLALDAANTVVLRGDAARSFDRFADPDEIERFAFAASIFRSAELGGRPLSAQAPGAIAPVVLSIREATDRLFRDAVVRRTLGTTELGALLRACADGLSGHATAVAAPRKPFGDATTPIALEAALALSALSLLPQDNLKKLKICPNCNWLFVDRSRNGSRLWCDMAVCGNRQKAKRHYRRGKSPLEAFNDA